MNTNSTRPAGAPAYYLGRDFATWRAALGRRQSSSNGIRAGQGVCRGIEPASLNVSAVDLDGDTVEIAEITV
jgi:hypothetical protein